MKFASILVSALIVGAMAQASELNDFSNMPGAAPSIDGMTLTASTTSEATAGVTQAKTETPMFGKETSTWNFNLGMSEFDINYESGIGGMKGKGLTFEVQKRFWDMFYVGGAYTNYTITELTNYSGRTVNLKNYSDVLSVSLESHVIRMPLPGRSEFFAAVNGGLMAPVAREPDGGNTRLESNYFIGAGIGFNLSNQIGVRADIKSTTTVRAYNSVSLVGYY